MSDVGKMLPSSLLNSLTLATGANAFLTKMMLASAISAFALTGNSQEGVIGSMLVSPLGGPVMGLAGALVAGNMVGVTNSVMYLVVAFAIMIGVGVIVGKHFEDEEPTSQMSSRYTAPNKYTMVSAIIIGFAFGLVALSGGSIGEGVGAGIAISLLPPAVNVGLTMMKKNMDEKTKKQNMMNSLNISLYNCVGIALACIVLFGVIGDNSVFTF